MSNPTTTLLGSSLPPHLSGASPVSYYCGNMVWQNMVENSKKIYEENNKKRNESIVEAARMTAFTAQSYNELHEIAFLETANERMMVENAPYENLNTRDHNGNTPLMWAASQGNERLVEALLDQGAMVNMQNFVGETALFIAAARGFYRICSLLIEHGADTRFSTIEGATPLHIAAASGHLEVIKVLISKGAFINSVDEEGDCPLHYAIREGQATSVELLARHFGADVSIKNDDLESPLDLANELGESSIADFLSRLQSTITSSVMSDHPLYFGEEDIHVTRKEQQAQVDEFIRTRSNNPTTRSISIY